VRYEHKTVLKQGSTVDTGLNLLSRLSHFYDDAIKVSGRQMSLAPRTQRRAYVPNGSAVMAAPSLPDWRRECGERFAVGDNRPNMHVSRGTKIEFQARRIYVTPAMAGAATCKQTPVAKFAYGFRLSVRTCDLIAPGISASRNPRENTSWK